jgi:hypothetical protein
VPTSSSSFIDPITATIPGTYTVMVDPAFSYTGNATLRLFDVPADVTGTITPGGSSVTVTTTVPGQNGRLTFTGTSGQRVSLRMSSVGMLSCGISIRDANNIVLQSASVSFGGGFIEPVSLPSSGQFSIVVDPTVEYTGSITLTLYNVPADGTGTITVGGSSVPVTIAAPGQNARLTFSGTEGQRVSVTFSAGPQGQLSILRPDDSVLASGSVGFFASMIEPVTLPSTGTYTLLVDPMTWETGSVTITLHNVPADFSGSVTIGGDALLVTTTQPGQNAAVSFSGTANQQATVTVTGNTMGLVTVTLRRPDGSTLTRWLPAAGRSIWS